MLSDLSVNTHQDSPSLALDRQLSFSEYIAKSQMMIANRRVDLNNRSVSAQHIIETNSPFELRPPSGKKTTHGALLIHGLLDCPFSLRNVAESLQANGVLCRAILLPGHGTSPQDLLTVSYQDWIQAVRYGFESLQQEVDHIYLIGYSTGAALSVYQALQDASISGVVLLSPAIRIKAPIGIAVAWQKLTKLMGKPHKQWMYREKEIDYAKYQSIPFNSITQVAALTNVIHEHRRQKTLNMPVYMVVSREDETISSHRAIDFFSNLHHQSSRLLLYTSIEHRYPDKRIITRLANYPAVPIKHYSHVSIPFAPSNPHYGEQGDYPNISYPFTDKKIYGAYNRIELNILNTLHTLGLTRYKRGGLTYNPDFDFMMEEIVNFILHNA